MVTGMFAGAAKSDVLCTCVHVCVHMRACACFGNTKNSTCPNHVALQVKSNSNDNDRKKPVVPLEA